MTTTRFNLRRAVIASVVLHCLLISFGLKVVYSRWPHMAPVSEPMAVRLVHAPDKVLSASKVPVPDTRSRPRAREAVQRPNLQSTKLDESSVAQPSAATAAISPRPAQSASSPSTSDLLNRIADGVLHADKAKELPEAASKPWLAKERTERGSVTNEPAAIGGRVERVQSAWGTYCIRTPNAATAYRNANGLNLVGASNCP